MVTISAIAMTIHAHKGKFVFGGEISDEEAQSITTVGEAIKYIEERML